ncbi:MAG: hypothetical protein QOE45_852 [Frankiaceae bacterium]|nr:hypothetical protein [Frankiaceae bacterium]
MKKIAIATLALGAVISSLGSIPAALAAPSTTGVDGFLCGFGSGTNLGAEPGTQTGQVTAGPAFIDDGATPPGVHSGRFICTIQVGYANKQHTGTDAAVVEGPTTTAVIAAQGQVTYRVGLLDSVYLCTEIVVDGTHLYFNDPNDPTVNGSFDTTPNVDCGWTGMEHTCGDCNNSDETLCPIFASVFPPEGDIVLPDPVGKIWDCPPYDPL